VLHAVHQKIAKNYASGTPAVLVVQLTRRCRSPASRSSGLRRRSAPSGRGSSSGRCGDEKRPKGKRPPIDELHPRLARFHVAGSLEAATTRDLSQIPPDLANQVPDCDGLPGWYLAHQLLRRDAPLWRGEVRARSGNSGPPIQSAARGEAKQAFPGVPVATWRFRGAAARSRGKLGRPVACHLNDESQSYRGHSDASHAI